MNEKQPHLSHEEADIALVAMDLYKVLFKKFGRLEFSIDDIDQVEARYGFKIAHYDYLQQIGVLVRNPDDLDRYSIAKKIPEV